jgi:hypothetical protein
LIINSSFQCDQIHYFGLKVCTLEVAEIFSRKKATMDHRGKMEDCGAEVIWIPGPGRKYPSRPMESHGG